jgi:hypothetical protein
MNMSKNKQRSKPDPTAFTLYTQENFYTPEDLEAAAKHWPRQEVEGAFRTYRDAIDIGDHATMATMLSEDGRGGNATYGFFHDRESYREFLISCWLEIIPNYNVWHVIEGGRIVEKWCEVLPGTSSDGGRYDYFGINEVIYGGDGQFRLMYSIPDLFGLRMLYVRWRSDGQHEVYGDIYPGLVD